MLDKINTAAAGSVDSYKQFSLPKANSTDDSQPPKTQNLEARMASTEVVNPVGVGTNIDMLHSAGGVDDYLSNSGTGQVPGPGSAIDTGSNSGNYA